MPERRPVHHERGNAVNENDLRPIWTTADFREAVMLARALSKPDLGVVAPVIDIRTRERIA
jgi:hypothetical protein